MVYNSSLATTVDINIYLLFVYVETYRFYDDIVVGPLEVMAFNYDVNRCDENIRIVGIIIFLVELCCRSFERDIFPVLFAPLYIRPDLYNRYIRESPIEEGCNRKTETKAYNKDNHLLG